MKLRRELLPDQLGSELLPVYTGPFVLFSSAPEMLIRELLQEPNNGKSTNSGKQQPIRSTEKLSF
jgi:hypothetical protein